MGSGRDGQLLPHLDFVGIVESVGLGNVQVPVGIAVKVFADLRQIVARLDRVNLVAGNDLNVMLEVGETGIHGLDTVPDAVLAGF